MARRQSFEAELGRAWPPDQWRDLTVVVAVSGGADSVALLRAMAQLKTGGRGQLVAAHFNHHLRADADDDQAFVVQLSRQLAVPCQIGHLDRSAASQTRGEGLESVIRGARYRFLRQSALRWGARYVATAHTADDQAETILQRIIRGTGVAGLAGIPRTRTLHRSVTLIRPLLDFRRSETTGYLKAISQPCRSDKSNFDWQFTRNRIRGDLLPRLQADYNPQVVQALLRLGSLAAEAQAILDELVEDLYRRSVQPKGQQLATVRCDALAAAHPYLVRQLLIKLWQQQGWPQQSMGYAQWERLARMTRGDWKDQPVVQRTLPGPVTARREGDLLVLEARGAAVVN